MKNKRLLALFIVLIILVVLVVLGSTVFTVKEINVVFNEDKEVAQQFKGKEQQIKSEIEGKLLKKSVFFLTDSGIRDMIENPYIELIHAEVAFPNKVTLHIAERKEMFALEYSPDRWFMFDRYGIVLREHTANSGNPVDALIYDTPDGSNIEVTGFGDIAEPMLGQKIGLPTDMLSALIGITTRFYEAAIDRTVDITWQIRVENLLSVEFGTDGTKDIVSIEAGRNHLDNLVHTIILEEYGTEAKMKFNAAWAVHEANLDKAGTIRVFNQKTGGVYTPVTNFSTN